jgi:hypothetical protein
VAFIRVLSSCRLGAPPGEPQVSRGHKLGICDSVSPAGTSTAEKLAIRD